MLGPARLMVDPAGKKLLSQAMAGQARAFRLRYMTLCVGAIAGQAIGGVLYNVSPSAFFAVPAFFYGSYMMLVTARRRRLAALETRAAESAGAAGSLTAALRDRRLIAVIGAGIVIFVVFSQLESMIPLYMKGLYGNHAQSYYAVLFITNAVLALAFQVPIDRVSAKLSRNTLIALGCAAFALSYVCFWASSASKVLLFVGITVSTVGEGILLPMPTWRSRDVRRPLEGRVLRIFRRPAARFLLRPAFRRVPAGNQRGGVFRGDGLTDIPLRSDALP